MREKMLCKGYGTWWEFRVCSCRKLEWCAGARHCMPYPVCSRANCPVLPINTCRWGSIEGLGDCWGKADGHDWWMLGRRGCYVWVCRAWGWFWRGYLSQPSGGFSCSVMCSHGLPSEFIFLTSSYTDTSGTHRFLCKVLLMTFALFSFFSSPVHIMFVLALNLYEVMSHVLRSVRFGMIGTFFYHCMKNHPKWSHVFLCGVGSSFVLVSLYGFNFLFLSVPIISNIYILLTNIFGGFCERKFVFTQIMKDKGELEWERRSNNLV